MSPANAPMLLRWTQFPSDPHGTGSEKRSFQIRALGEAAGFAIAEIQPPARAIRWSDRLVGLGVRFRFGRRVSVDGARLGLLGYRSRFYRDAMIRHRGARILLWETTYDTLLPTLARATGYRIVGLPHNVEALASEAAFMQPSHDVFRDLACEFARLGLAETIFAIAREECWLLETRGLRPHYLPYFPPPELEKDYLRLRAARLARCRPDGSLAGPLLLVGSAINPPTGRGMRWQLEQLRAAGWPAAGVVVIGPQTENRLADFAAPGVRILGSVSWEELTRHLAASSAVLIHTCGGTGAVTRIPEALLAGVPVIANGNAARNQHGTPGVHVYGDPAGFLALIRAALPIPPAPQRPAVEERRFQSVLQLLAADPASRS